MTPGWWRFPLGLFAAHRVALMLFSFFALLVEPQLEHAGGMQALHGMPLLDGLCRWDCGWFEYIAIRGYDAPVRTNFWPLFPLAGRALAQVGVPLHYAFLLLANGAGALAWLLVYRLFAELEGAEVARWAMIAWAAFPFSFFQAAAYPESVMIFFTAWAVVLARRGSHLGAAISLGVGVLSRHITILSGLALAVAQLRERGLKGFFTSPRVLTLAVPFLIAGVYPLWQWHHFGDALAFWRARDQWGDNAWWGLTAVWKDETPNHFRGYALYAVFPTIGAVALLFRKRWAELAAFAVVMMTVFWAVGLAGLGRYAASCWPAFLPLGVWLARWPVLRLPVVLFFGLGLGVFFNLFVHQFPIL